MVPLAGVEPARFHQPRDFKSRASAYSATTATTKLYITFLNSASINKKTALSFLIFFKRQGRFLLLILVTVQELRIKGQ